MTGRVLRTELRHGPWMVPVLLTVVLAIQFNVLLTYGPPSTWSVSVLAGLSALVIIAEALALAVAVWRGGRERRRGTDELIASTPRPRLQRALAAWLPTAAWPALAWVAATLAFGILSLRAASGPPLFGVIAAAIAALAAATALGFVLGWWVPGRFVAPAAGAATYIGAIFLGDMAPFGLLSPVPVAAGSDPQFATWSDIRLWDQPVWWFTPATAVWFGALAAALLTASLARRRWLAVAPAVIAALAAAPLVWAPTWRVDTASPLVACSDGQVRVCVPDVTGARLAAVADSTRLVRARLAGVPGIPEVYVWPQCMEMVYRLDCSWVDSREITHGLAEWVTMWRCGTSLGNITHPVPPPPQPAPRLWAGARAWLLGHTGDEAPEAARRIAAMPETDRQAWLSRYLHAAQACDTSSTDELRSELRSR